MTMAGRRRKGSMAHGFGRPDSLEDQRVKRPRTSDVLRRADDVRDPTVDSTDTDGSLEQSEDATRHFVGATALGETRKPAKC